MAFVLRFGLYKLTVLPFGLCNALNTFQRLVKHMFSDPIDQYIFLYLDNILLYRETSDSHEKNLCEVFL